ncbi:MAG: DUF115 domain-containing protein [Spirochaetes bacterium]|nr:DUF115 domain-containing protein [Spirochaetota bacterium]
MKKSQSDTKRMRNHIAIGNYTIQDTPSGFPTLLYRNENTIRLHSAYDPVQEAKRSIQHFQTGRANVIAVCGLGLGYHIQALSEAHPSKEIIVIEKDIEVINITQKINPSALQGIIILTSPHDIPHTLDRIDMASFCGVAVYRHRPSYLLFKEFYDSFEKNLQQYFSSRLSDMLTRVEFIQQWAINILHNVHHLFDSLPVKALFGKFRGIPGIIVSAGPSLRHNVNLLTHARDKALIVCVDTAFKVLEKHSIAPHIVMTLDAQRHSIRHFLGVRQSAPLLLADLVSYPAVLRNYSGNRALSTTSKFINKPDGTIVRETTPLINWIENWVESPGDIQSGGSVATSAFDLLLSCGCAPIVLVGQDLAYTGREIHCSGTHHNEEWVAINTRFRNLDTINQQIIRKRKIKYVEGWMGKNLAISDFVFDLYRNWFADSAGKVPIQVINATEGGAHIPNTIEMEFAKVIETFPLPSQKPEKILHTIIQNHRHINQNPSQLFNAIERSIEMCDEILALSRSLAQDEETKERIIRKAMGNPFRELIGPLIKRAEVYIARHPDLTAEQIGEMLSKEIVKACTILRTHLRIAHQNIFNYASHHGK